MKQFRQPLNPIARSRRSRRGFTTPAVAVGLLVAMCGLALILDRLWLDAADLELTTAAENAAIAAASQLATDDLFKTDADPEARFDAARNIAAFIASQNLVAGDPVILDSTEEGDIRLGRLVIDDQTGRVRFEETTVNATTAVVTAMRTRASNNPVALFVAGATGQPFGDVVTRVEASVDNRVRGVRPFQGTPVPAFPIAIWWRDPSGRRLDTWENQIEARKGADQWGYDAVGRRVFSGTDGIPEIVLHSRTGGQPSTNANMLIVDLGTGLKDGELKRQFASGWTVDDLAAFGGEMPLMLDSTRLINATSDLGHSCRESLEAMIGEPRICLLYSSVVDSGTNQPAQATCVRLVAIRVLAVRDQGDGSCEVVAQPCVVKTRTALLDVQSPYSTDSVAPVSPYSTSTTDSTSASGTSTGTVTSSNTGTPGNPYIYKIQLSH